MSHVEAIVALATRAPDLVEQLQTEEATKNALIMPFLGALGYNVFDPREVVPEFTADVGTKKGEKVDYAIKRGEDVVILVEAKKAGADLSDPHHGQLFRYFAVTNARIAILTNGLQYRFFSDLDAPNKMDELPFLEIDLLDLREELLGELSKLTKEAFDLDTILSTANELKYKEAIRKVLVEQFADPKDDFVKFFFTAANPAGRFTQSARELFSRLVKQALEQFVADTATDRLKRAALAPRREPQAEVEPEPPSDPTQQVTEDTIHTTEEELEGFRIVRAIVCSDVPAARIAARDTKSYFGVLFDDNNRKPVCRLRFNHGQKYIGLFDEQKNETRKPIDGLEDIYEHATELRQTVQRYVGTTDSSPTATD